MKRPFKKDLQRAEELICEAIAKLQEAVPLVSDDVKSELLGIIDRDFNDICISILCDQEDDNWDVAEGEDAGIAL